MWEYALNNSPHFAIVVIVVCSCATVVLCEFFKMVSRMHKNMLQRDYYCSKSENTTPKEEQKPTC